MGETPTEDYINKVGGKAQRQEQVNKLKFAFESVIEDWKDELTPKAMKMAKSGNSYELCREAKRFISIIKNADTTSQYWKAMMSFENFHEDYMLDFDIEEMGPWEIAPCPVFPVFLYKLFEGSTNYENNLVVNSLSEIFRDYRTFFWNNPTISLAL